MKHNLQVTLFLLVLFLAAQAVGLALLNRSIISIEPTPDGRQNVTVSDTMVGRPELEGQETFNYMVVMIIIGTAILLLLIRFKLFTVWKIWFFLAVFGALAVAFGALMPEIPALVLGFVLAFLKLYKPNIVTHNITEVMMYSGIVLMIAPLFTLFWMSMLLIIISVYDAIAVWKSGHMVTMAKAQAESKMFAGLMIPYSKKPKPKKKSLDLPPAFETQEMKSAILGGGDIAFPLLFSSTVMLWLIENNYSRWSAFLLAFMVSAFAGLALFMLLTLSKKDKFYPAMPFISAGCFLGLAVVYFIF